MIRPAEPSDAETLVRLSEVLGYPVDAETMGGRLTASRNDPLRCVGVACIGSNVAGWIEVGIRSTIESGESAEILGLVVDPTCRRRGVGRALVQAARAWAHQMGQRRLRVRTNVVRHEAPLFYTECGFRETKRQSVLETVV